MLERNEKGIYQLERFMEFDGIIHGMSDRDFGNMSFQYGDEENVRANRLRFLDLLEIGNYRVSDIKQVHSDKIKVVDRFNIEDSEEADGLITSEKGLVLLVSVADCYPIYFYDPVRKVIGIAHVGWRGAAKRLSSKVVRRLCKEFNSDSGDILIGIGPGICYKCYKFEDPIQKGLSGWERCLRKDPVNGFYGIDLTAFIIDDLISIGIKEDNICLSGVCTREEDDFYSHTLFKKGISQTDRRFISVITLRK